MMLAHKLAELLCLELIEGKLGFAELRLLMLRKGGVQHVHNLSAGSANALSLPSSKESP